MVACVAFTLVVGAACSSSSTPSSSTGSTGTAPATAGPAGTTVGGTAVSPDDPQAITALVADVPVAPIPFAGSDGKTHLVYELFVVNATPLTTNLQQLDVLDGAGQTVETVDQATLATTTELVGNRKGSDNSLEPAQAATIYLNLTFAAGAAIPKTLTHRLSVTLPQAPPGKQSMVETAAPVRVDNRPVPTLSPPLAGSGYVAADACCTSSRHRRALLAVNGSLSIAQRYAIDWEQIDAQGRIYNGERTDPKSYTIFGKEALAMGDGTVVKVVDGLPEQVPGKFPDDISAEDADGNAVILDLGQGNFLMYAHLQPGSPRVKVGQKVKAGDVLGLVGNSGNSVAPHLHIHLMDSPLSLASSGLPYTLTTFTQTGQTVSTAAFDTAEAEGTPLDFTPVSPPTAHTNQYPMDQSIVTMGSAATGTSGTTGTTKAP